MVRIALKVNNPIRRVIATIGLLLSVIFAYVAAAFSGSTLAAAFVTSHTGIPAGFLLGTMLSVYLSVMFSILIFHAVSFVFL